MILNAIMNVENVQRNSYQKNDNILMEELL